MGRPEKPIESNGPESAISRGLRDLRRREGSPTYRELAERTGNAYTPTALSKAASGARIPTLEITLAFVRACSEDEDAGEWERRWRAAKAMLDTGRGGPPPSRKPRSPRTAPADDSGPGERQPNPLSATTPAELAQQMRILKICSGDPSFEVLARRAAVSRSTLHAALRGDRLPKLWVVRAFAIACGEDDPQAWERAWKNIAIAEELRMAPKARRAKLRIVKTRKRT